MRPLDFWACVHDDVEAGLLRASGRLLIDNAKLEPDAPGADRDRLVDVLPGPIRATEDVDDIDREVEQELLRSLDLERLRDHGTGVVLQRLTRERGIGPWSVGVIAIEGLGRYDQGLVGDLGLIKLLAALRGRWVEAEETAELLAPYEEWQGLAGLLLISHRANSLSQISMEGRP